jgi:hypothetical protein
MCQKSCGFCKEEDEANAKTNNYKFVPAKLTRNQHVEQAKSSNCCLAMPTTNEKQQLIKAAAKGNSVWVGGLLTAFDWQWEDGSDWKHQDWANGDPSFSNNNEHGIEMKVDGKWNDIDVNHKMSAVYHCPSGGCKIKNLEKAPPLPPPSPPSPSPSPSSPSPPSPPSPAPSTPTSPSSPNSKVIEQASKESEPLYSFWGIEITQTNALIGTGSVFALAFLLS